MALAELQVIVIAPGITNHAGLLHDPLARRVHLGCEGCDLRQTD